MSEKLGLLGGEPVRSHLYPQHTTMIDEAEEKEVLDVLRSGHLSGFSAVWGERFSGGPKVRALEEAFAKWFGVKYAVSVNSATSALHCAVAATRVEPGEEVVTSPYTMGATASCILMQNAIPVFADIDEQYFCLDPVCVEASITPRTRAILTVNLFGHPSPLDELKAIADRHGLTLIEDNAQAPGAMYRGRLAGTVGEIGIQSLNYHKCIQTGEGGIALTDNPELALHMQLVRNHGEVVVAPMGREDMPNTLGWNYRLSEVAAAIGIPQLAKLNQLNEIRVRLANYLTQQLAPFDFLTPPRVADGCTHVYYIYPMRFRQERIGVSRELFARALRAEGISISEGYVRPIYLEPMYQRRSVFGSRGFPFRGGPYDGDVCYDEGICRNAEHLWRSELLTTDICKYPNREREVEEFVRAVDRIAHNIDALRKLE